jgi:hypothetical protein
LEQYPWMLTRHTGIHAGRSVMSQEMEKTFLRTKDIEQQRETKEEILSKVLVIKRHGKKETKETQDRRQAQWGGCQSQSQSQSQI